MHQILPQECLFCIYSQQQPLTEKQQQRYLKVGGDEFWTWSVISTHSLLRSHSAAQVPPIRAENMISVVFEKGI